ncbi:hypothetical protein ACO0LF_16385 [Undibacterium sp. Di27W]|uniref:hypothetical protein n=1 Tax=Undibacterium sp. Di27W TaxID=3413036 RepID=UPI003BEFF89F
MAINKYFDHFTTTKIAKAISFSLFLCASLPAATSYAAEANVQTSSFKLNSIATDNISFSVTNSSNSIGYYKLLPSTSTAPSPEDMKRTGSSILMNANQTITQSQTKLFPSTGYVLYFIAADSQGNLQSNVQYIPLQTTRNELLWPFHSNSIWNMPIGSAAQYADANLPGTPGLTDAELYWSQSSGIDKEIIVLTPKETSVQVIQNTAGWSGNSRCYNSPTTTGKLLATVPMPADYLIPHANGNNGAVFLMQDSHTLLQMQPTARCAPDEPATALLTFKTEDLYGTGTTGAHGGSRLSTLGGTLRVGELRPNSPPPRHALKLDVDTRVVFPKCSRTNKDLPACYRWPAEAADSGADGNGNYSYGKLAQSNVSLAMSMGALLALPPSVDIGSMQLETPAAKQLAWTLQNYGTYIVDSSGGSNYFWGVETGPNGNFADQFKADWGFDFAQYNKGGSTAWVRDMQRIIVKLKVVVNNSATSIGGGGTPLQPLAVPLQAPTTQLR